MNDVRESERGRAGTLTTEQVVEQRVAERTRELTALLEVARSLTATLELEPLLDRILEQLRRVLDYRTAGIFLTHGDTLETVASRDSRGGARERRYLGHRRPLAQVAPIWERLRRGDPLQIGDVGRADDPLAHAWRAATSSYRPELLSPPVRAWLAVPLSVRGQVVGYLALTREAPDSFTARDTELALAFAGHAAVAIDNARLVDQERRARHEADAAQADAIERAGELGALLEVATALTSTLDLEPLLGRLLDQLHAVTEFSSCGVLAFEGEETRALEYRGPLSRTDILRRRVPLDRTEPTWRTLVRGEAVLIDDVFGDSEYALDYRRVSDAAFLERVRPFVRAWLAVPLVQRGEVRGALVLTHPTPGFYTARHAALALSVASQAAVAIENARLYERERRTAQELATLLTVARGAASTLELGPLLTTILDTLTLVVDYDGASIGVVDEDEFRFLEARGASSAERRPEMIGVRLPMREGSGLWEPLFRHEPVIIADIRDDSAAAEAFRRTVGEYYESRAMRDVRSFMAIPLVNRDRLVGLLTMSSRERGVFNERHAGLALAIATHIGAALENARLYDHQAAVAIQNAELYEQERRTAQELASLLEVSQQLGSTLDLERLLDVILDQTQAVATYDGASLLLVDGDVTRTIRRRAPTTIDPATAGVSTTPVHRAGPIGEALLRRESVIIDDVRGDSLLARAYRTLVSVPLETSHLRYVRSWMAVPLVANDRVIGILLLSRSEPNAYTARHSALVSAIATQAAAAIENARLYEQAHTLAVLEERQRLARELHDSVSQALFGIALGAGAARRRLDLDPAKVGESLDYVLSLTDVALTEMRALIFELRPETLEKEGLVAALSRHAAATQARHEIPVATLLCEEPDVPLATKEALYRIAQEAMHNAAKYARGTRIEVMLARSGAHLVLEVRDDGIGFDPSQDFAGHLGLHSMRERMAAIGGTTEIVSAPGHGTRIRAAVPSG